jgi:hypothetical protein
MKFDHFNAEQDDWKESGHADMFCSFREYAVIGCDWSIKGRHTHVVQPCQHI